jgi:hypothetical protein
MATWTIKADFGSGLTDIAPKHVQKITRDRRIHNELSPSIDTCTFVITEQSLAISFQTTSQDIPIEIDKDGSAFFRGIVRPNYSRKYSSHLKGMQIEAVDYHYQLQKRITSTFSFSNIPISDPTDTANSFVHQIFWGAGIDGSKLSFDAVSTQITEIAVDESDEITYWKLLSEVLWEYGYVTYQQPDGTFEIYNLYPTSISFGTLTDSEVYHGAQEKRREFRYERVRVNYSPIETVSGVTLWSETRNQDDANRCNVSLSAGSYYPSNCNSQTAYAKYKLRDYEVIRGENVTLNSELSGVTVNTFNAFARRAEICLYSSGGGTITQLDIEGDAVVRDTTQVFRAVRIITAGSQNILDYDSKYLDSEAKAQRLASGLADYYTDSIYTYKFLTHTTLTPGEYYTLDSNTFGVTVDTRVLSTKENRLGEITAVLEAVAPVNITVDVSEADFSPAEDEPDQQNKQSTAQQPTFNNLESGLKDDGTNLYVAGTVITGQGIKSDNYVSGSQGWAIDGDGDAEFNDVIVRGTVEATTGDIAGWTIQATKLVDSSGQVEINSSDKRMTVLDSLGNVKTVFGYLGGIEDFADTEYGFYVAPGNAVKFESGGTLSGGDYEIGSDGAIVITDSGGDEIGRFGSLAQGDIGFLIGNEEYEDVVTGGGGAAGATWENTLTGGGNAYGETVVIEFESTLTAGGGATGTYESSVTGGGDSLSSMESTVTGGANAGIEYSYILADFVGIIGGSTAGATGILYEYANRRILIRGDIISESMRMIDLPTSKNGLRAGDVWKDGETLKVVS